MSTWPDGSVYIGFWKDGKKDGLGRMRTAQGHVFNDSWRKGKRAVKESESNQINEGKPGSEIQRPSPPG